MLDATSMIIEVVSTDERAPSVRVQKNTIRKAGIEPEKTLEFPGDLDIFALALRDDEDDVVVVSSPRMLGTGRQARACLEAMARRDVRIQVAGEDPISVNDEAAQVAFLARVTSTPWGKATSKQLRNRGRPTKRKQPDAAQKRTLGRMWRDPDNFTPAVILAYASEELGRKVVLWELKHWFGAKRSADES